MKRFGGYVLFCLAILYAISTFYRYGVVTNGAVVAVVVTSAVWTVLNIMDAVRRLSTRG